MKKRFLLLLRFCIVIFVFSCKKTIDPPTLHLSSTIINLGSLSSLSAANLNLNKIGEGTITYTVSSDKSWLKLSKPSGTVNTLDSLKCTIQIPNSELLDGENVATLTIIPTINGEVSSSMKVNIVGTFKTTTLVLNKDSLNLGTIKGRVLEQFDLSKSGSENLSYEVSIDKPWITVDKPMGNVMEKLSLVFSIDPTQQLPGNIEAIVTINFKINNVSAGKKLIYVKGIYDNVITGEILGHKLNKDEIWGGQIYLNGSVTVPSGLKLTIKSGTKIAVRKATDEPIKIIADGNLYMVGTPNSIIEVYSATANPTNQDWEHIQVNGDAEIAYCVIRNALNGLNFVYYAKKSEPKSAANIHHILFDNVVFGILGLSSNFHIELSNLTFRNYQLYGIGIGNTAGLNIKKCEFQDPNGYIDVAVSGNSQKINITNCNFVVKKYSYNSQLEIINGFNFNAVNSVDCYNLLQKNGFDIKGNTYTATNILNVPNSNVGCGFASNYANIKSNFSYRNPSYNLKMYQWK